MRSRYLIERKTDRTHENFLVFLMFAVGKTSENKLKSLLTQKN